MRSKERDVAARLVLVDLHPAGLIGGCEKVFRQLARTAARRASVTWLGSSCWFYRSLEVVYRILAMRAAPLRENNETLAGVDIVSTQPFSLIPFTTAWRQSRNRITSADVIYCKNEFLELCLVWFYGGDRALHKTVVGMHSPVHVPAAATNWHRVHALLYKSALYRHLLSNARQVHALSSAIDRDLDYVYGSRRMELSAMRERILLIPNGVEQLPLRQRPPRATLQYLCVGRLAFQKGFDRLPSLLEMASIERVTVVGDGDQAVTLRRAFGDRAEFLGALVQEQTLEELSVRDVLLMPSRWDNLPLTLLEAMAAGCIPIVSAVSELNEVLPGTLQWLAIDFDQPAAFLQCVRRVERCAADVGLDALRHTLREHVREHFDEKRQLDRLTSALLSKKSA